MNDQRDVPAGESDFSTWLGFGGRTFRWEAPLWFFASFLIATAVARHLGSTIEGFSRGWPNLAEAVHMEPFRFLEGCISSLISPTYFGYNVWFYLLIPCALLLVMAVVLLRLLRNRTLALATAALVGTLAAPWAVQWMEGDGFVDVFTRFNSYLFHLRFSLYLVVCSGVLALALRRFRSLRWSLLTAALAGAILPELLFGMAGGPAMDGLDAARVALAITQSFLFVGLLRLGQWLSSEDPGGYEPRLRRGFYLKTLAAAQGLLFVLTFEVLNFNKRVIDVLPAYTFGAVVALLFIGAVGVFGLLIYKMWAAIQDGDQTITPGQAVGFLFVPFFNYYWAFRALPGFASSFNAYSSKHGLDVPPLAKRIFIAYVLTTLASVPVIILAMSISQATRFYSVFVWTYIIVFWFWLSLLLVMASRICRAVNGMPERTSSAGPSG